MQRRPARREPRSSSSRRAEREAQDVPGCFSVGFKEIEVGFPAASQTVSVGLIIEEGMIPDDITDSILCQAREELIARSCEALKGAKKVIFTYNSTSTLQRKVVFRMERPRSSSSRRTRLKS